MESILKQKINEDISIETNILYRQIASLSPRTDTESRTALHDICKELVTYKTLLFFIQGLLSHEFNSLNIDIDLNPDFICKNPEAWFSVIDLIKRKAENYGSILKRNR
jgi:hypothetical protein